MTAWWRHEDPRQPDTRAGLPAGVEAFVAPHLFMLHTVLIYHQTLVSTNGCPRILIFRLSHVPFIDRQGARTIGILAQLCRRRRTVLLLSDVQPDTWRGLGTAGVIDELGPGNIFVRWNEAVARARHLLGHR